MEVIKLTFGSLSRGAMSRVAQVLATGGVIVYPSDTVYGLGAIISCKKAIEKIRYIKGREGDRPLSILVRDMTMARRYSYITAAANEYLPGPYTILTARKPLIKEWVSKNELVGIRLPDFWFTQELMHNMLEPIIATSANLSNYPPAYSITELLKQLGDRAKMIDLIVDIGILPRRPASTIVNLMDKSVKRR